MLGHSRYITTDDHNIYDEMSFSGIEGSSSGPGNLEARAAPGFERWKETWQLKMTLMDLKETKSSWAVIARDFRKIGVKKSPSAWCYMWTRCNVEVSNII